MIVLRLMSSLSPILQSIRHMPLGGGKGGGLGLLLIERVREIARRIKGVTRIQVPYRSQCFLRV